MLSLPLCESGCRDEAHSEQDGGEGEELSHERDSWEGDAALALRALFYFQSRQISRAFTLLHASGKKRSAPRVRAAMARTRPDCLHRYLSHPLTRELLTTAAMVVTLLAARSSLADHYQVPTGSMEPTVMPGDRVLVDKTAYGLRLPGSESYLVSNDGPQPGDVVVLDSPESGITLLKRVVAVPGDVVRVEDGHVLRNGEALGDPNDESEALSGKVHALRLDEGGGPDLGPIRVPSAHYLVMGDNRGNSHDGRMFGFVRGDAIRGRAVKILARDGHPTWTSL
jgi:signal peptidase I